MDGIVDFAEKSLAAVGRTDGAVTELTMEALYYACFG